MSLARLDGRSFDPETLKCMGSAFDAACKKLGITDKTDPLTQLVAERVVALARRNFNDPAALSETVLRSLIDDVALGKTIATRKLISTAGLA